MTGRTTADMISDVLVAHASDAMRREVAEHLAELYEKAADQAVTLRTIDALRLPCPTCGGTQRVTYTEEDHPPRLHHGKPCPDCTDGRMSHEQGWKIVADVFADDESAEDFGWPAPAYRDHLRSLR